MWFRGLPSSPKAEITLPRANSPKLMATPSWYLTPVAPVFFGRSDPAKSTKWNFAMMLKEELKLIWMKLCTVGIWIANFYLFGIQMVANWMVWTIQLVTTVKSLVTKCNYNVIFQSGIQMVRVPARDIVDRSGLVLRSFSSRSLNHQGEDGMRTRTEKDTSV